MCKTPIYTASHQINHQAQPYHVGTFYISNLFGARLGGA